MTEAQVQAKLIKKLKSLGCFVVKLQAGPGVPIGSPDVLALKEGWWGAFECKRSIRAKWQPRQKERLQQLNEWSYGKMVCPENYNEIMAEVEEMLR